MVLNPPPPPTLKWFIHLNDSSLTYNLFSHMILYTWYIFHVRVFFFSINLFLWSKNDLFFHVISAWFIYFHVILFHGICFSFGCFTKHLFSQLFFSPPRNWFFSHFFTFYIIPVNAHVIFYSHLIDFAQSI